MKPNIKLSDIIAFIIFAFIMACLTLFCLEAFTDTTILNRAF